MTRLVHVPLAELGDELLGLRLIVRGNPAGRPWEIRGGLSDVQRLPDGRVALWVGGRIVRLGSGARVLVESPKETP